MQIRRSANRSHQAARLSSLIARGFPIIDIIFRIISVRTGCATSPIRTVLFFGLIVAVRAIANTPWWVRTGGPLFGRNMCQTKHIKFRREVLRCNIPICRISAKNQRLLPSANAWRCVGAGAGWLIRIGPVSDRCHRVMSTPCHVTVSVSCHVGCTTVQMSYVSHVRFAESCGMHSVIVVGSAQSMSQSVNSLDRNFS